MDNKKCTMTIQIVVAYFNQDIDTVRYGKICDINLSLINQIAIYLCKTHYKIPNKTLIQFFNLKNTEVTRYIYHKITFLCSEKNEPKLTCIIEDLNTLLSKFDAIMGAIS